MVNRFLEVHHFHKCLLGHAKKLYWCYTSSNRFDLFLLLTEANETSFKLVPEIWD